MDKYLYFNKDLNGEVFDLETAEYFVKNDRINKNKSNIKGKITVETSEIRSFITKIIFRDIKLYKIILEFFNEFQNEIENINEYRNSPNLFKFYIKGNMALLMNLLEIGYYNSLMDKKIQFDPSDIDTNLFINTSTSKGVHLENISKSLSQRLFYKYRRMLERNKELVTFFSETVVDIANNEEDPIKKKYNIKKIRKVKCKDRLMYKKKSFVSRWKMPFDNYEHNIIVSFNETIDKFMLYRLFIPYIVEFEDGSYKLINAELADLSIVSIDPKLSLYTNPAMHTKISNDINLVIKKIKENKKLPVFNHNYHLEQLLWNKIITEPKKYLTKIIYFDYELQYASLKYLLYEYCLILINDPTDIKNPAKIQKIKIILDAINN